MQEYKNQPNELGDAADLADLLTRLQRRQELSDRPMMTFYRSGERAAQYTYRAVLDEINCRVSWLLSMGIKPGDRVAILSPNSPEVPFFTLALMRIGAASVPLNPGSPETEWEYILEHAGVRGLLGTEGLLEKARTASKRCEFARDIANLPARVGECPNVGDLRDVVAVILYTSGTTARPKGVAMSHANILLNVRSMASNFGLHRTTQLSVLPLYHAHAFNFGLMTALLTEGHFVFTDHFDPFVWTQLINREQVTVTSAFPTLLPLLQRARIRSSDVPGLRCIMVTSAPLPSRVAASFEDEVGIPLMHGWGLSETTCLATCLSPEQAPDAHRRLLRNFVVPSMGTPLPGTEVAVFDPGGRQLGPMEKGELCVRGGTVMTGYFMDPKATAETVIDGWLHSGDEGFFVVEDGKPFFFITGRIKEIIIRGGENVSPLALEEMVLERAPQLRGRFAVLGFEHELFGEEIGAYVECTGEDRFLQDFESAITYMRVELRPKVIIYGEGPVPRTHTGKVQRRKLLPHFSGFEAYVGPPHCVAAGGAVAERR